MGDKDGGDAVLMAKPCDKEYSLVISYGSVNALGYVLMFVCRK
jgi:hypothetical protein